MPEIRTFTGAKLPEHKKPGETGKREPRVEIWLPPEFQSTERKWPLIVFSHGFGGCSKQSEFLTSYLADNGYIVIAPDHNDANCRGRQDGRLSSFRSPEKSWPEKSFRRPETWDDKTEADRRDDMLFAVSSMLDDRQYKNYIDTDHMGLIGHSLGGYTVLGMAGAWPSWKDKRFKAVLALSPYMPPYLINGRLKGVNVPVMYQGGTKDTDITPLIARHGGAYDQTAKPKYFLEFEGANHFAWTELDRGYQDLIRQSSLAFFDKYLKEKDVVLEEKKNARIKLFKKDE